MKTSLLPASFAVAVMASAADLKDPAEVAREWSGPLGPTEITDFSLRGLSRMEPRKLGDRPAPAAMVNELQFDRDPDKGPAPRPKSKRPSTVPHWGPIPRDKIYDAPNYRVPEVLPDNMPPGTKLWKYGGGTYYLMPLIPARDK